MILTGTYERAFDEKQRLALPKRLREQMGGDALKAIFATPEPNQSLGLWTPIAFERLAAHFESRSSSRSEYRNYLRLFYARAEEVPLDAQGRLRIAERLLNYAGIQKDVVLLGVQDHVEVWDQTRWTAFLTEHGPQFDAMASQAFE